MGRRWDGSYRRSNSVSNSTAPASTSSATPAMSGCSTMRSPKRSHACEKASKRSGASTMAEMFRVALSGDFRKADGSPTYPDFDLGPLRATKDVEIAFLESANPLRGDQLEDFDALILLAHRFSAESVPASGRLAVVARFGVGYDTVDLDACTRVGIALAITPDGIRRPVAVAIITLMLALTSKLIVKDRLTREAAAGFAKRSDHMGVGLVGRTLGSVGIGNIGAELFRMAKPFEMRFIAHDPFADAIVAAELGVELVSLE